ncbi:MAG: hypothetical protein KIT22_03080 [Verrucomicrobiae bacterium]|nr:hypothetical protein [Verrucomicrobiae bacterium]
MILATPRFIADPLLGHGPRTTPAPVYAPWLVANLTLDSLPTGRGAPLSGQRLAGLLSLGYIVASHQSLHPVPRATVLTYYLPLDAADPVASRRAALERSWESWRDEILRIFACRIRICRTVSSLWT